MEGNWKMEHLAEVRADNVRSGYRAVCWCGYVSGSCNSEETARNIADSHNVKL